MDRIIFLLGLFMFLEPFESRPDLGSVQGCIYDAINGKPLRGALALLGDDQYGALSDDEGKFVIERIPPGEYLFRVKYRCFDPWILRHLDVQARTAITLDVGMINPARPPGRDTLPVGQKMRLYHPDDPRSRYR